MQTINRIPLVVTALTDAEIAAVERVLRSGQLAQGPEVRAFEEEFADAVGSKHAVAFNSGTAAIHGALAALNIGPGDVVSTTPFTFAASATPILMLGATPRFVDIHPREFNADEASLLSAGSDISASVGVDLFGLPFKTQSTRTIPVVEDACQAVGAARDGKPAGSRTEVAAFSFYATKNIMTGEGGMLTTDSEEIANSARRFRHHGQGERYEYLSLGFNYRMTDVQAAIGRVQLSRLHELTERRIKRAERYSAGLRDVQGLNTPEVPDGVKHCYHQYSILINDASIRDRDAVRDELRAAGIDTGIYYPKPLHMHPLFSEFAAGMSFPVAEQTAKSILALPMHDVLSDEDQDRVIESLRRAVAS